MKDHTGPYTPENHVTDHEDINVRLTAIETKLDIVLQDHAKRLDKIEAAVGRQYLISSTMSALGIGIALLVKSVISGAKS